MGSVLDLICYSPFFNSIFMLKKLLLLLPLAALLNGSAQAQFRYTFKDTTTAYAPLPAGATLVTGSTIWDDEDYTLPMPFSWALDSTSVQSDFKLSLGFGGVAQDLTGSTLTGFTFGASDFIDRGAVDNLNPKSPVRYLTTGTAPNRIFKVEIANAGFIEEQDQYGTLDDSVNIQVWIYEGSSILEMHYGPSRISNFNDYFDLGFGGPSVILGFVRNFDPTGAGGTFYYLSGPPFAVSITSASLPLPLTNGLTAWPANGKVFRFTPIVKAPAGIAGLTALGNVKVYPNPAATSLTVEGATAGTKATLYSIMGQPVLQTLIAGNQTLDIALLPAGVYKLVLTNKEGVSGATTIVKE